ncbi:MAG TPA: EutN/CcmL family microcompartment protein [Candidatus Polarisedimenticolia bacterium]|nr:EutN/CcmL family microcompartment protein [Candidatus Polarisedimenticolia bacterium]
MNLARVVGRVVATRKDEGLRGRALLVLQPLEPDGSPAPAAAFVAVDAAGSGAAELVLYVKGREAAHAFLPRLVPADAAVVGIVDAATLEG